MKRHKILPLLLSAVLIVGLFAGCDAANASGGGNPSANTQSSTATPNGTSSPLPIDLSGRGLTQAASYEDVYKALSEAASRNTYWREGYAMADGSEAKAESAPVDAAAAAPAADELGSTQGTDYSQTNVQVKGVDEGDIVKTDGQYIYVLRNNELIIFKADGATTTRISSVTIGSTNTGNKPMPGYNGQQPDDSSYYSEYASDIYVTGDTAVIISSYSSYGPYLIDEPLMSGAASSDTASKTAIAPAYNNQQIAKVYIFDISDRSAPSLKAELGQDGYVLTTRLIGSTLYMLSNYYVYTSVEGSDETYIPRLYANGDAKLVAPECISIMPWFNSQSYTVICAYDLTTAALSLNESILGGGSTVYMNENTLFIASSTNEQTQSDPYTDSVYTVIDYTMTNVTDITSFDISGGKLALIASGSVPGSLSDQFAMDEYDGHLRLVTTNYSQSWSEYTDKAKGFVNYVYKDPYTANALYILDGSLKTVGSVQNLAEGEQVYSVRFDGTIGYFVTFRQVDPLFAVDLSDPASPTVLSALKIPGFSEYLHVWSDGRLFGLGMDADSETGRTDGMKLSMFDTTDPANVTEKHSLKLDTSYSNALYNHKAILISPDKSIIAFPADNGYDIYGYSDEQGFFKRAGVSAIEWSGDSRGLYIGDFAYIIDNSSISVLDMTSFILLNRISY